MPARRRHALVALAALLASSGVVLAPVALTTTTATASVQHHKPRKHRFASPRPTPTKPRPRPRPTATPTPAPSTTTAAPSPTPTISAPTSPYPVKSDWASAVLDQLNAERSQNGLGPLTLSTTLTASAHRHNVAMADANTLSHQLPGEAGLGDRATAAGYRWSTCGENIAWNGRRTQDGVLALQTMMYEEKPPNDGHRRNILSTSFTDVGVDVIDDSVHGKVWLTTDFGRGR